LTNPSEETFPEYQRVCLPLYTQRPQPPEVFDRMIRHLDVMQRFRDSGEMVAFDYRGGVKSIRCPVLLMAGALDPIVTIEDARELAAALPQPSTTFREFPGAGHLLALEHPDAVASLMTDFIAA
jgi:pimeloyl-ACP methyl ester carboxylesterase